MVLVAKLDETLWGLGGVSSWLCHSFPGHGVRSPVGITPLSLPGVLLPLPPQPAQEESQPWELDPESSDNKDGKTPEAHVSP